MLLKKCFLIKTNKKHATKKRRRNAELEIQHYALQVAQIINYYNLGDL